MSLEHIGVELTVRPFRPAWGPERPPYGTVIGLRVQGEPPLAWDRRVVDLPPRTVRALFPVEVAHNTREYVASSHLCDPEADPSDHNCASLALTAAGIVPARERVVNFQEVLSPAEGDDTPVPFPRTLVSGASYGMADSTNRLRHMLVGLPHMNTHLAIPGIGGPLEIRRTTEVGRVWGEGGVYRLTRMPVLPRD
jgi:hypothetical protein